MTTAVADADRVRPARPHLPRRGASRCKALQGLDLVVASGELTALVGASGMAAQVHADEHAWPAWTRPPRGRCAVAGARPGGHVRAGSGSATGESMVGFIWQQTARNLLPYLTALQNIELPLRGSPGRRHGAPLAPGPGTCSTCSGVAHCAGRRPDQMSGGEQQRVAIAVVLANSPSVLLADEPTGELDSATAASVFAALQTANNELGVTVLVVTHDPAVSSVVRRTIAIRDGRTATETLRHGAVSDGSARSGAPSSTPSWTGPAGSSSRER